MSTDEIPFLDAPVAADGMPLRDYFNASLAADSHLADSLPIRMLGGYHNFKLGEIVHGLRRGNLIANARCGVHGERRDVPADIFESVWLEDVDAEGNSIPKLDLWAIRIRKATRLYGGAVTPAAAVLDSPKPPGRPSMPQSILEESNRRIAANEQAETLAAEARYLRGWYNTARPTDKLPAVKTLENNVRDAYRGIRSKSLQTSLENKYRG